MNKRITKKVKIRNCNRQNVTELGRFFIKDHKRRRSRFNTRLSSLKGVSKDVLIVCYNVAKLASELSVHAKIYHGISNKDVLWCSSKYYDSLIRYAIKLQNQGIEVKPSTITDPFKFYKYTHHIAEDLYERNRDIENANSQNV